MFAGNYGKTSADADYDARYDLTGDGAVDFSDFLEFAGAYGCTVGTG